MFFCYSYGNIAASGLIFGYTYGLFTDSYLKCILDAFWKVLLQPL